MLRVREVIVHFLFVWGAYFCMDAYKRNVVFGILIKLFTYS